MFVARVNKMPAIADKHEFYEGLRKYDTKDLEPKIVYYILQALHTRGKNPQKDLKIEQAWKTYKKSDREMLVARRDTLRPWYLRGPTGHGKTVSMITAAETVAKLLGARFIFRPGDNYEPGANDFIFNVLELAGEVSNTSIGGIVFKQSYVNDDGQAVNYMVKLPSKALAAMKDAPYSFLMLDDFANAAIPIQASLLSALLDNKFQNLDFGNTAFGLAGNMGTDGTKGINDTAAITTRVRTVYVEDQVKNFIERTLLKYGNDSIADAHLCGFLTKNPDCFFDMMEVNGKGKPFRAPRQWDAVLSDMREAAAEFDFLKSKGEENPAAEALDLVREGAFSLVGQYAGNKLHDYMLCMWEYEAAPLAKEVIINGKGNETAITSKIASKMGLTISQAELDWGLRFATACADYAASEFIRHAYANNQSNANQVIRNFSPALFGFQHVVDNKKEWISLDDSQVNFMMTYFVDRIGLLDTKNLLSEKRDDRIYLKYDVASKMQDTLFVHPGAQVIINGEPRIKTLFSSVITHQSDHVTNDTFIDDVIDDFSDELQKKINTIKTQF